MSDRRKIDWTKVRREPRVAIALAVATAFGPGLLPLMPGTWGSLAALPLAWATQDWDWMVRVMLWLAIVVAGTWAAKTMDQSMGVGDHQSTVIDEVAGMGIATWTVGSSVAALWVAFVLFRIFDMTKLPPVRQVDLWSKKSTSPWAGGFGVIADDLLAGVQALAVLMIAQKMGFLR